MSFDDVAPSIGAAPPPAPPAKDAKGKIVDALMELAADRRFEDITITDIAERAGVTLADFRDAFPSKGAVLGGFGRRIDRAVLEASSTDLAGEPAKERLFDVLMRRLDAMAPWRGGVASVLAWARREPLAAVALNQQTLNSMRFMLEAAGIESEGSFAVVKLQGLALAWANVLDTWTQDDDPGQARTMAALDRALTRGGQAVGRIDDVERLTAPLRAIARSLFNIPAGMRARRATTGGLEDSMSREDTLDL